MRSLLISLLGLSLAHAEPLTYDTNPLGTLEKPLILRTFVPDPGLDPAVLSNHGKASKSPKYNPGTGLDVSGEYQMMKVIPAAIAVNHGPALSYVFDTVECRVLYAWQGGFLDLYPYWGDEQKGGRRSFDYGSRLVGNLFYLAQPVERAKPKFLGYKLSDVGVPTFRYRLGDQEYTEVIAPSDNDALSFARTITTGGQISSRSITGEIISKHQGFERDLKIKTASIGAGETVFGAYGCIACHSTDGSKGHGPSLQGLFGITRALEGGSEVVADEAYVRESILTPNARTAKGFPPNYMPPYQLKPLEVDSLVLYIQSLANSSPE
ncbi:cytochrome c [Verrucomicrobiaceae bacterium 227]